MSEPTYQLDADEIAALEAAEELVTMHRAQDINLAQHARLAAFVTKIHMPLFPIGFCITQ